MVPIYATCPELLRKATSFEGEAIIVERQGRDPTRISFPDLLRLVKLAGANMAEMDVGRRDKVVLLGRNSIPWAGAFFGANSVRGAVPVPLSVEFKKEIAHIGQNLGDIPLAIYEKEEVSSNQLAYLKECASRVVPFAEIAPLESTSSTSKGTVEPKTVEPETEPPEKVEFSRDVQLRDTAVILYTSGTMRAPKGVPLTHRNITANIVGTDNALVLSKKDRLVSIAPWDHVMGLNLNLILSCYLGMTLIYTDKYKQILDLIGEREGTLFLGVPKVFSGMIDQFERFAAKAFDFGFISQEVKKGLGRSYSDKTHKGIRTAGRRVVNRLKERLFGIAYRLNPAWAGRLLKRKLGSQFRYLLIGGAPISEEVLEALHEMGLEVVVGYGVTENSPLITITDRDETNRSSVGQPVHNVSVAIDDPDESGIGEVLISGPSLFNGYKNLPELTEEKFEGQWYRTGDMGKFEKGAYDKDVLTLVGRKGNIIVPATGVTVYAEEVETALRELVGVPWIETYLVREGKRADRTIVELVVELDEPELGESIQEGALPGGPSGEVPKEDRQPVLNDEKVKEAVRGKIRTIIDGAKEELAASKLPKRTILLERDSLRRTATLDLKRGQEIPEEKEVDRF